MDQGLYRRRQRRRAAIGWTAVAVVGVFALLIVIGAAFGSSDHHSTDDGAGAVGIFTASMSSKQYEAIREGEEQTAVYRRLGSVGMGASEVQEELLTLFPHQPSGSNCAYWFLSDAPEHLVRLCFDEARGVLVQKSVAAQGESEVPKTLV